MLESFAQVVANVLLWVYGIDVGFAAQSFASVVKRKPLMVLFR
jgi:hypothetical protein